MEDFVARLTNSLDEIGPGTKKKMPRKFMGKRIFRASWKMEHSNGAGRVQKTTWLSIHTETRKPGSDQPLGMALSGSAHQCRSSQNRAVHSTRNGAHKLQDAGLSPGEIKMVLRHTFTFTFTLGARCLGKCWHFVVSLGLGHTLV